MQEAWIQLRCPDCGEQWEANPVDLPEPQGSFTCEQCDGARPVSEFTKTARDFEILESFHE
ncbi:hypothetical protein ACFQMA_01785 [Halosimplex aquaticum]|uniref:DUF7836 domain-containing protein n=1 Tax=Halosimplex aquaticum TaxID=3026162 RepID=A0ABD5Y2D6_9EURY|nr:hypothetical protein [Halosimplex aquaticum]